MSPEAERDLKDEIAAYAEAQCWNLLGFWPAQAPAWEIES